MLAYFIFHGNSNLLFHHLSKRCQSKSILHNSVVRCGSTRRSSMIDLIWRKDGSQPEDDFWSLKFLQGSDTFCIMMSPKWGCLWVIYECINCAKFLPFAVARRDKARWSIWYYGKTEHKNQTTIFDLWSFSKAQRLQNLCYLPVRVGGGSTTWVIMNWRCLGDFQTERYV